jgi:hypothetical protein
MLNLYDTFLVNKEKQYILEPILSNYIEVEENGNRFIIGFLQDKKIYVDVLFHHKKDVSQKTTIDRITYLEHLPILEIYPTVVRWMVLGANLIKFIDIKSKINKDYCICKRCGLSFDYLSVSEAGMGYIYCPGCGEVLTQADCI